MHICYRQWKKHILELFNMKLSKTIDQTRMCKKSYGVPLGYFCMGLFVLLVPTDKWPTNFTCPTDASTCLGQTLLSRHAINMSLHSDTLSWYRANQSLLFLPNGVSLAEKQQILILKSLVWPDQGLNPRSTAPEVRTLTITPPIWFK